MKLWYNKPAGEWTEALPLGNGRLGAMVFGGEHKERFQLNEDTLWAGYPTEEWNEEARVYLPQARQLLSEKKVREAEELIKEHMLGKEGQGVQPYQPLGDLWIDYLEGMPVDHYRRELSLDEAVAIVSTGYGEQAATRTTFISAVHQVMVVHLECGKAQRLHIRASLDSKHIHTSSDSELLLYGRVPRTVRKKNNRPADMPEFDYESVSNGMAMSFAAKVKVLDTDGTTLNTDQGVEIRDASRITLLLAARTSFDGFMQIPGRSGIDPVLRCDKDLQQASMYSYDELLKQHVEEYRHLYGRVDFKLGGDSLDETPTDERLLQIMDGREDPEFYTMIFQYGRYLLISCSRQGTQPANLQGIWNDEVNPPWNCDYHFNINLQMNYWLAEIGHLSECHEPLFRLVEEQSVTGARTAEVHYGCRGWMAHAMSDIWRTNNVGSRGAVQWAYWQMGGAWLCRHLWEHYQFSGNREDLARAWPLIRGAATFMLDWLQDGKDGTLTTSPSTSPENSYLLPDSGKAYGVSEGSTMDISIAWDLLTIAEEAALLVGGEEAFSKECRQSRDRLRPFLIGSQGQLLEWQEEFAEKDPRHRHLSHLYGFYPGNQITNRKRPEQVEAVRRTMEIRGDEGTGWSMGWKIAIWARLRSGERALGILQNFLHLISTEDKLNFHKGGIYPNLFCAHPPFQIDGNFGAAAGIAEMLLQSHSGRIELLPALPVAWKEGHITGLRARGGFTVSMHWTEGRLKSAVVTTDHTASCTVDYGGRMLELHLAAGESVVFGYESGQFRQVGSK